MIARAADGSTARNEDRPAAEHEIGDGAAPQEGSLPLLGRTTPRS
jgi:hypothetical protein